MLNSKLSLASIMAVAASAGVAVPTTRQPNTSRSNWARNDQTESVFKLSRCKYLNHTEMTKKIESANRWNDFVGRGDVPLSRTGRIKHEHDQAAAMRTI